MVAIFSLFYLLVKMSAFSQIQYVEQSQNTGSKHPPMPKLLFIFGCHCHTNDSIVVKINSTYEHISTVWSFFPN